MSWDHGGCLELCFAACQVHKVSVCNNVALTRNIINIILKILTAIVYLLNYKLPMSNLQVCENSRAH